MAALVPAIHVLLAELRNKEDVDARHKAGHDSEKVLLYGIMEIGYNPVPSGHAAMPGPVRGGVTWYSKSAG
jgi:hypothetical protein